MNIYLRSLLIGISIAAPVGPIGVLCIRRTMVEGRTSGLVSGLGAATADAVYGVIAGFGLTLVSGFLIAQQGWIRLLGGAFLCYLGLRTFFSPPSEGASQAPGQSLLGNYLSTFALTLTNPMTILSFAAVFASLGLAQAGNDRSAALKMILGVFSGSALWWLTLSAGVGYFRDRVTPGRMKWINRISGIVILGFGILAVLGTAFQ